MNSLGTRIAHYRKKLQLTQEQLAEKFSVTPQAVSKWENDLTAPDIALIPSLAELFGISCDELFGVRRAVAEAVDPELIDLNKVLLKVKVDCAKGDEVKVNLPLSIADAFLKSGAVNVGEGGDVLKNIDIAQIISLVKMGAVGKLVEVKSAAGDTVEVWVE